MTDNTGTSSAISSNVLGCPNDSKNIEASPNSIPMSVKDGAELTVWNERYFFDNHFPKNRLSNSTQGSRRAAGINLIKFFSGMRAPYEGLIEDIRIAILAVRSPADLKDLLFAEFVTDEASGEAAQTSTVTLEGDIEVTPGYSKSMPSNIQSLDEAAGLEEYVSETHQSKMEQLLDSLGKMKLNTSWTALAKILVASSESEENISKIALAETAIGLICMHCFKLLNKTPESVMRSMTNTLQKHFRGLYKEITITLCPPHINSLKELKKLFGSPGQPILDLLSLMIGKVIIELSKPHSIQPVRGVLCGACLNHVTFHGLTAVELVEQTADALKMPILKFVQMIATPEVEDSLLNAAMLFKLAYKAPGEITIMGKTYTLRFQFSWRFCRIYNSAHFSRFTTAIDARLILRCAAFLSQIKQGSTINKMKLLTEPINQQIFQQEMKITEQYIVRKMFEDHEPLTDEAKAIFGRK